MSAYRPVPSAGGAAMSAPCPHGSPYAEGDCGVCEEPARHKVEEVDAREGCHPYTAYLCCSHFVGVMGWATHVECAAAASGDLSTDARTPENGR